MRHLFLQRRAECRSGSGADVEKIRHRAEIRKHIEGIDF